MSVKSKIKKDALGKFQQNKVNRVVRAEKRLDKTKRSKSDEAYIRGNYSSGASMKAYGVRQARSKGETVYGYDVDDIMTGGRKASRYKQLKKGENPYEAKYLYTGKPTQVKNSDGSTFTSKSRFLTKNEKDSFKNTGELYHKDYAEKKKQAILGSANPEGTKFTDHLNTLKWDGLEVAKANKRSNQPIKNAVNTGLGFIKDVAVDPLFDAMKIADVGAGALTGAVSGVLEQSGNAFTSLAEGKNNFKKGLIKDNVKASLDESAKTGWGKGFGDYTKEAMNRGNEKYGVKLSEREQNRQDTLLEFTGLGMDMAMGGLDAKTVRNAVGDVAKSTKKGAKTLDTAMRAQNELGAVASFKAGNYQDELAEAVRKAKNKYSGGKGSDSAIETLTGNRGLLDDNEISRGLNKSYDVAMAKNDVKPVVETGKPKLDTFLSRFEGFGNKVDGVGVQRNIDGRTLNKKYTQTKDGYIPRTIDDVVEETKQINHGGYQMSFDDIKPKQANTPEQDLMIKLNSFDGRNKEFKGINPIKLQDESGELKFLMKDILRYKSKIGKADKKGGLLNSKTMKLPKGKREEFINALNDNLFDGKPVITKHASYGYLREFADKFLKNTPEQFYNEVMPKISSSLTDPSHYKKGQYLKEFGGIGEYQKYVDETNRLIEKSRTPGLNPYESRKLNDTILERQDKIRKRNKLAEEIYGLEPEVFQLKYGDNINANNPLGIKDRDWKHDNQIGELMNDGDLVGKGELTDYAQRINTNAQETFKSSPQESQMENASYLTKQMWDIVSGSVGEGKRVSQHRKDIDVIKVNIDKVTKELEDALENLDFDKTKELNKAIKELNLDKKTKENIIKMMGQEFNKVKKLVSDEVIDQQQVVNELLGDTYKKFPYLKTNGERPKVVHKVFPNLSASKGMDNASVNIARRIAEQHGITEPKKMSKLGKDLKPIVDMKAYKENKIEVQKLAELRVLQSFTKGAGGKIMDDALSLLIKSHMDNIKSSVPASEYERLQGGVRKYINDMKKAYASYSNPDGGLRMNPLERIEDGKKFYESKAESEAKYLDKWADNLYNKKKSDIKYDDAINSSTPELSVDARSFDATDVKPGDKGGLFKNLQLLASRFIEEGSDVPTNNIKDFNEGLNTKNPLIRRKYNSEGGKILDRVKSSFEKSYKLNDELPPTSGVQKDNVILNKLTGEQKLSPFASEAQKMAFEGGATGYDMKNAEEFVALQKFIDKQFSGKGNVYDAYSMMNQMNIKFDPNDPKSVEKGMDKLFYFAEKKGVAPSNNDTEFLEKLYNTDVKKSNVLDEIARKQAMDKDIQNTIDYHNYTSDEEMYESMFKSLERDAKSAKKAQDREFAQSLYESLWKELDGGKDITKKINPELKERLLRYQRAQKGIQEGNPLTGEASKKLTQNTYSNRVNKDAHKAGESRRIDEKLNNRLTPERMQEVLEGKVKPTEFVEDYTDKIDGVAEQSRQDYAKSVIDKNTEEASKVEIPNKPKTPLDEVAITSDKPNINSGKFEAPREVVEELASKGIDGSQKPPKEKPKDMTYKAYKTWLNTWKKGVTIYNPGWHVQNFLQNKGQNYLALGNKAFAPQTDAKNVLRTIKGDNAKDINVKGLGNDELAKLALDHGVIDSFGDDVEKSVKGITGKIDNSKLMNKLNENEQVARLHHFLTQIDRGMSPDEASKSVNKYLFDYSGKNDSKFDRNMKDFVDPFWTFHKSNAKLLGSSAVQHPFRSSAIVRGTNGLSKGIDEEDKQSEGSSYGMKQLRNSEYTDPRNGAKYNYMFDQGVLPDFESAMPITDESLESKLNPLAKVLIQLSEKKGNFGNDVVEGDKAEWGEITKKERLGEIVRELNPIMPSLINTINKNNERQAKSDEGKQGQEITDKQKLNEWIKWITGHKGNYYRDLGK